MERLRDFFQRARSSFPAIAADYDQLVDEANSCRAEFERQKMVLDLDDIAGRDALEQQLKADLKMLDTRAEMLAGQMATWAPMDYVELMYTED